MEPTSFVVPSFTFEILLTKKEKKKKISFPPGVPRKYFRILFLNHAPPAVFVDREREGETLL